MSLTSDKKFNILIVDDTPRNIQIAANILGSAGHQIAFAGDGKRALNYISNRKPDLILLDIMMPEMDGFEVCQIIKADPETADIPIIFLTAKTETENIVKGFQIGAVDYITKPFNSEELLSRVKTHLKISQLQQEVTARNEQLQKEIAEHKKTAAALKEREELFRGMFETHSAVMLLINPETGLIINANKAASDYYGYSSEELSGMAVTQINTSSDLNINKTIQSVKEEKQNYFQFQHRLADGQIRDVEVYSTPIVFQGHTLLFSVIHDITDRRRAEEKLVNANIFLDQIISAMPNPVFVKNEQHRWLILNDAFCDFMGYASEQLIGKSDYDFFPKEQADVFWEKDNMVFKSETVHSNEEYFTDSEGKLCTILTKKSVMTDINGEKILVGIITDITERKNMEDALRKSESMSGAVMDIPTAAAFLLDREGVCLHANETLGRRFGKEVSEIIGKPIWELFPPDVCERRKALFKTVLTEKKQSRHEDEREGMWNDSVITPIMDDNGEVKWIAVIGFDITDRKKAEKALRDSEEQYRDLVQNANNVILRATPQWEITFFNRYAQEFFGYTEEEILGKRVFGTIVPDAESLTGRDLNVILNDIAKYPDKYRYNENENICKNGRRVWLAWTNKVIADSEGNPKEILCIANDITEKKQAEQALRESGEKYRNLVENLSDALFMTDNKGTLSYISPIVEKIIGLKPEEIVGRHLSEFFHPEDLPMILKKFQKMISGQDAEPSEVRVFHKSGEVIWIRTSSRLHVKNGVISGLQGLITDINARKQTEQALKDSEEQYRNLVENINDAVYLLDNKGNFIYISPVAEKIAGYKPEEIIGNSFAKYIYPEDLPSLSKRFGQVLEGRTTTSEYRIYHKSGKIFWARTSSHPRIVNGVIAGAQGLLTDITDRKQAEEALKRSNSVLKAQQESSIDGIVTVNEKKDITGYNKRFIEIWNIPDDIVQSRDDKKLLMYMLSCLKYPDIFLERIRYLYENILERGHDEIETTDDRTFDWYCAPIVSSENQYLGKIWFFRDISERKAAEKKLLTANKAVMDSIHYAEFIQQSILPNIDEVKIAMPDSFFIWLPRDIVGGDIFFVHLFDHLYDRGFVVAVIDCTGHGVPGAFMSMIAFSALKRIVSDGNCDNPAEILKRMNKIVKTSLRQDTAYALSDDGLDAAVCSVKIKDTCSELTFAGAKIPLYYVRNGEIRIIKGDRQSIGYKRSNLNFDFSNYMIPLEKGTIFYMATDGFTDQLDGNDRRFGTRRFRNLLKAIFHLPFEKQRELLLETFEAHKGSRQRQDDVTVAGFGF